MKSKKSNLQYDLSIVIPAYREEKRIGQTLDALAEYLNKERKLKRLSVEVIVSSADSTDKTHEIIMRKKSKFAHFVFLQPGPKFGKGRDVQYGMLRARGNYVIFMDADLATPLYYLPRFFVAAEAGNDLVVGTRNLAKHHPGLLRRAISNGGNILFRFASGIWIEDSQCGFKMFNARANKICFSKLTIMKWGFDMEVLAIAKANGLKIKTVRIDDWQDIPHSTMTDDMLRTVLRSLRDLGEIIVNRIRGIYVVTSPLATHDSTGSLDKTT